MAARPSGGSAEPTRFVLALHCHQPIGNFGWVFERATEQCYRPLLQALDRHPAVPYVLHVSGPLLEWWLEHAPDLVSLMREGTRRGQVELLASGLFEPILPAIPRRDRVDQVRLHRAWLRDLFGVDVDGLWLTERVWEPTLPSDLAFAGIRSVLVDDSHFEGAGLHAEELDGDYATEDQGRVVRLYPIRKELRYLLPFKPVKEIVEHLRAHHDAGRRLLVFGDDGEKFGLWPGTRDWVHRDGWLEEFLAALEAQRDWLHTTTLAEAARALLPTGRVYLPTASYFEMSHWSLPPPAQRELDELLVRLREHGLEEPAKRFLRGATWRNFLARYPEAARLQQRMVRVSERTHRMGLRPPEGLSRVEQLHPAVRALFRGQCNCAYWHGVFGGLYLPFLRDAVVHELLEARARLEALRGDQEGTPSAEACDVDADGVEEVVLEGRGWSVWISPERGGAVEVLDHWPKRMNLLNVLARRPEAYHEAMRADAACAAGDGGEPKSIHDLRIGLEDADALLSYDPRPRGGFVVELAPAGSDPGGIADLAGPDLLGLATRRHRLARPLAADVARAELRCELDEPGSGALAVAKSYSIRDDGALLLEITLRTAGATAPWTLAVRFDLSTPGTGSAGRAFLADGARRIEAGGSAGFEGSAVDLIDERGSYRLRASRPFSAAIRPIRTVSRSEGGVDTCVQGSGLALAFPAALRPSEAWRLSLELRCIEAASVA
jgi:alpha-amylase